MANIYEIVTVDDEGNTYTPYGGKIDGNWVPGMLDVQFLQDNFGQYNSADEMITATASEGLKLYFAWLCDQGKLP